MDPVSEGLLYVGGLRRPRDQQRIRRHASGPSFLLDHRREVLARAFDAMQVASLLREYLWSYVSDLNLSAPGVDYMAYAGENRARLDATLSAYRSRWGTE